jgi:hypothetical protein
MKKLIDCAATFAVLVITSMPSHANVIFTFSEVGADVIMTSSGILDTTKLIPVPFSDWGGTGIEDNGNHDIMGGTEAGGIDTSFGFHAGTDFSQWASANGPWSTDNFSPTFTGTKDFTTYHFDNSIPVPGFPFGVQVPGIGVYAADIVNGFWTPDQIWTFSNNTFASLNMFSGTYSVSDIQTNETITFQMIGTSAVPEPATLLLVGLGMTGLVFVRRRQLNA